METAVEKAKEMRRRGKDMNYRLVEAQACKARAFGALQKRCFSIDFNGFQWFFNGSSLIFMVFHGFFDGFCFWSRFASTFEALANVYNSFERLVEAVRAANEAVQLAKKATYKPIIVEMMLLAVKVNSALVLQDGAQAPMGPCGACGACGGLRAGRRKGGTAGEGGGDGGEGHGEEVADQQLPVPVGGGATHVLPAWAGHELRQGGLKAKKRIACY